MGWTAFQIGTQVFNSAVQETETGFAVSFSLPIPGQTPICPEAYALAKNNMHGSHS
jgi:hypothetical protein